MRHALVALLGVLILVGIPVLLVGNDESAQATGVVNCSDTKIGQKVRIKCTAAGVVVLDTTVDLPVVTLPGATVTIPGDKVTVRIPGPTRTVTAQPQGGTTVTETVRQPGGTVTRTEGASPRPRATVTETVTPDVTPTGQPDTDDGTMSPEDDETVGLPDLTTPEAVGLGTLALLGLVALILLAMWGGYTLGYKDSDKAEAKFIDSLLRRK